MGYFLWMNQDVLLKCIKCKPALLDIFVQTLPSGEGFLPFPMRGRGWG